MGRPGVIAFPVLLVLGAITGYLAYDMLVIQSTPVMGIYENSPYRKDIAGEQTQDTAPAQDNAPAEEESSTNETTQTEEPQVTESTPSPVTINAEITPGALNKSTDAYAPNPIEANVGDTVVWTNKDTTIHTVTSGTPADGPDGLFGAENSDLVFANAEFQYTFDATGEYDYYCTLHPAMVGKVIVSG